MTHIETALPLIPPGTPVEGGFFSAYVPSFDGRMYRLIVPPKALSEVRDVTWKESAEFTDNLGDCVRPNKIDGMVLYETFAPHRETTPEAFRTGGPEAFEEALYWLEGEYKSYPDSAWVQDFTGGNQYYCRKFDRLHCRAIRKFLI